MVSEQIPLNPSDYCPYSATGSTTVRQRQDVFVTMVTTTPVIFTCLSFSLQGGVVYANYGRPEDFNWLKSAGVSVVDSVVVMRVGGGVSFAEKVRLAERNGAGGALIYPDPADLPQDPRRLGLNTHTAVSEHVTRTHTNTHMFHVSLLRTNQNLPLCHPITGPPGVR